MIVASQLFDSNTSTLDQSLRALDAVNFFVGGALASFGPFVALFLGGQGWAPENVGFVLTIGSIAGLVAQIPGGELLDAAQSKRLVLGLAMLSVGFSALMIGAFAEPPYGTRSPDAARDHGRIHRAGYRCREYGPGRPRSPRGSDAISASGQPGA